MDNNLELQMMMKKYRIKQWEVAEKIGFTESKLSRLLRKELSEENYLLISEAINELRKHGEKR